MAFRPLAQALLTVKEGRSTGTPVWTAICRARLGPLPACRAWPTMISSTFTGVSPARFSDSSATMRPSSTAGTSLRAPPNLPIGVRTAEAITMSVMCLQSYSFLLPRSSGVGRGLPVSERYVAIRSSFSHLSVPLTVQPLRIQLLPQQDQLLVCRTRGLAHLGGRLQVPLHFLLDLGQLDPRIEAV